MMGLRELFSALAERGYWRVETRAGPRSGETSTRFSLQDDPDFISLRRAAEAQYNRPRIICLCGSTRFYDSYFLMIKDLARRGAIVLEPSHYIGSVDEALWSQYPPSVKEDLSRLRLRKIDLADEILVLNVGGYIGESTRSEIDHALRTGKPVKYLEPLVPERPVGPPGEIVMLGEAPDSAERAAAIDSIQERQR